jgi:hypothetical protein
VKWCCAQFKGCYEERGDRGISIMAARLGDGPASFLLQARAIAIGDSALDNTPAPFTLASQIGILCCPWCGCSLERFYRQVLDQLAEQDRRYVLPLT